MLKNFYRLIPTILFMVLAVTACKDNTHFLTNKDYRDNVHEQFSKRKNEAVNRQDTLFSILEKENLTTAQREAMEFLYAYMPLCDLADYDGTFFLKQVDAAFKARDYFHWGKSVPEDIFRHFVLVYRVNNEYLDTARTAFFEELKDRIKDLSMSEAALEVNHWCHEKVTYRGTDGRTSAPLALVRTSWGRCGEESTFTAAALRAVGIPARQCYTPRWVHTDDNHAWVEVWIEGKWHYMGACKPEPELNVAWFTAPAKRTMMVHTNVFGLYTGPEEKNKETTLYSTINLLPNYAPTRQVKIKIIDEQNQPVEGATVKFKVYNYAELYPITTTLSDADGTASIISGMGDLMIWANKGTTYGYEKSSSEKEWTTVVLNRSNGEMYNEDYTISAPPEKEVEKLSPEKIAANALRLAHEDSIRNAYMATFATEKYAAELALATYLNRENVWKYLQMSQGNWKEIADFIQTEKNNPHLFPFLASLLEKDLRDTPAKYLRDHLRDERTMDKNLPAALYVSKVLSPRIALELIQPWRSFFQQKTIQEKIAGIDPEVSNIIDYINQTIRLKDEENYYNCLITPRGVYELEMADRRSRDVFFVALCRSYGIPAQIEEATGKPQYYENKQWKDVTFEEQSIVLEQPKGIITLTNDPANLIKPGYYSHYTLAFFTSGDFQTLDFENNPAVNKFPCRLTLDEGYYRLMVGSRANDGSVTIATHYFDLVQDRPVTLPVTLPEVVGKLFVKGIVDMNTVVTLENGAKSSLKELANGKGLMLCFVDAGKEPSKHILQDLPSQQTALEAWNGGILFMTPADKANKAFDVTAFKNLPRQSAWGMDNQRVLLNAVAGALQIDFQEEFPLTVYLSNNGGILYSSTGYRIGIGEAIVKTIQMEKESLQ